MTEPDDDATTLASRIKSDEDVTVLSARNRGAQPEEPVDDDDTRMSPRNAPAATDEDDATRLSSNRINASGAPAAPARSRTLPPGSIGGAAAERGIFGQPAQEYSLRELPESAPLPAPEPMAPVPLGPAPLSAADTRSRQESARHRRLIWTLLAAGVLAALITVAVFGIIGLLGGEG